MSMYTMVQASGQQHCYFADLEVPQSGSHLVRRSLDNYVRLTALKIIGTFPINAHGHKYDSIYTSLPAEA